MSDAAAILERLEDGDPRAADEFLPLVYDELRQLAAQQLLEERVNHTFTATALVHEAYLRLAGTNLTAETFRSRSHFFSLAARAMRRVLVDSARRNKAQKRGGSQFVVTLDDACAVDDTNQPDVEALNAALEVLEQQYPDLCELVSLRYFAGMSMQQAADVLGIPLRSAERNWHFARAWLQAEIGD